MTVTACRLQRNSVNYQFGLKDNVSCTAVYMIDTDNPTQGGVSVLVQAGSLPVSGDSGPLPQRYSSFSLLGDTEESLVVTNIALNQSPERRTRWLATVTWGTLPQGNTPDDQVPNPLNRRPIWWFEFQTETELVQNAWNVDTIACASGTTRNADTLGPIVNTALRPFDDPLFEDRRMSTLVIRTNYADGLYAASLNDSFDMTLNNAELFGGVVAKHCARFDGATSSPPRFENGYTFYEVEIRISLRREPFYRELVNQGFHVWDTGKNKYVKATVTDKVTGEETDAVEPVLLAANGTQLADLTLGNSIKYRTRAEVDYSPLEALVYP